VTAAYLRGEWLRTQRQGTTGDCAPHKGPCNVCGVQKLGAATCLVRVSELIETRRGAHTPDAAPARPGL
jgi:hypothetical protein